MCHSEPPEPPFDSLTLAQDKLRGAGRRGIPYRAALGFRRGFLAALRAFGASPARNDTGLNSATRL
jgi:hypothetical protein